MQGSHVCVVTSGRSVVACVVHGSHGSHVVGASVKQGSHGCVVTSGHSGGTSVVYTG